MNLMIMKILQIIKKNSINFFFDIFNLSKFYLNKKDEEICFFNERGYTAQYLENLISKKCKIKRVILLTFEDINFQNPNCLTIILKTNFFIDFFFLTANFKFIYSTTPNLNSSLFKKSMRKKIKYIYIQHSPVSLLKAYHHNAFLDFDAVQVVNCFQNKEIEILNKKYQKKIKPIKSNYFFLKKKMISENKIDVLLAPTWNTNFYKMNYHNILIEYFIKNNVNYIFRPHPMSLIKKEININDLKKDHVNFDVQNDLNIHKYFNLITDWSGILIEFAIIHKKLPFHIITNKKILNNDNFDDYETIEEYASRKITHKINMKEIEKFDFSRFKINYSIENSEKKTIEDFYNKYFYRDSKL